MTKLLVDDGRVQGVIAIDLQSGRIDAITAGAVILCTGGCGRVFPFTTNAAIKNGDGMSLAYRAGAPLKDMEFVQYHPTGLPFTGILITEAARAEGGYLINKDGYRYLQDYNLGKPHPQPVFRSMELGPRDRLSQAFIKELEKGRTVETPYGHVVHLDLRHLGDKKIDAKIPFVRELCMKYQNLDPVNDLIPVRPVVHYMMGGIHTDINGATPLAGLYAAGEAACVSINGANRLGSNSLPELLVFGARAGRAAAEYASRGVDVNPHVIAQKTDEHRRLEHDLSTARAAHGSLICGRRCRRPWSGARGSIDRARRSKTRCTRCTVAGAIQRHLDRGPQHDVQHRTRRRPRIRVHARRRRGDCQCRVRAKRVARRAPARRFSCPGRSEFPRTFADASRS